MLRKIHIRRNRVVTTGSIVIFATALLVFMPVSAHAQWGVGTITQGAFDAITQGITFLIYGIAIGFGYILTLVISLLDMIITFDKYTNADVVVTGWTFVRDIANIFFILVLLFIAIATILRLENYSGKRLLFKLILMAVLINFSRSIAGAFIDISQLFMKFFADSFSGALQGLLIADVFRIQEYFTIASASGVKLDISNWSLISATMLALFMTIISLVVILIFSLILVYRIVILWILIIVSPLAFLLHALPGGTGYASRWWNTFIKYVLIGPILTFFLWLAFVAVSAPNGIPLPTNGTGGAPVPGQTVDILISQISSLNNLFRYIVGIVLLVAGLMAASSAGVVGGSAAASAVTRMQRTGTGVARGTVRGVGRGALATARTAGYVGAGRFAGVIPTAKVAGQTIASKGGFRLATKEGRKQAALEKEARVQRSVLGGRQGTPAAEKALEKSYRESGLLESSSDRQNLINSKNPVQRSIGIRAALKEGDDGAAKELYKQFDTSKPGSLSQQQLTELEDLEKLAAKEDKLFIGRVTTKDGQKTIKSPQEIAEEREKKVNNRNENEIAKDLRGHLRKSERPELDTNEAQELADTLAAYDLDGPRLEFNRAGQRDLAGAIKNTLNNYSQKLSSTSRDALAKQYKSLAENSKVKDLNIDSYDAAIRPAAISAQGQRQNNVSQQFNRLAGSLPNTDRQQVQEGTNRLYTGIQEARGGRYDRLRTDGVDAAQRTFGAYGKAASQQTEPSNIVNPATGTKFSFNQLVKAQQQRTEEALQEFNNAVGEYEKAGSAQDKEAQKVAETRIQSALDQLEAQSYHIEPPEFTDKRAAFEAKAGERKSVKGALQENAGSVRSISTNDSLTPNERDTSIQEQLDEIEANLETVDGIYDEDDSIGLTHEQSILRDAIATRVEDLQKNKQNRHQSNLDALAQDIENLQGTIT